VRLSIVLLLLSLAGVLGGAALIGLPVLGVAVIFDSLCVGVWALARETGEARPAVHSVPTLAQVLEKARHAA
jgi:hypothetical protein